MKKAKRLIALMIAVLMVVTALASCVQPTDTVTVTINISATGDTLEKGASVLISAIATNGAPFTLTVDHNDIVEIVNNNTLRVKDDATIIADVEVTVTATLNDDPTVTATKTITVKAAVETVKVVLNASSDQINAKGQVLFSAVASDRSDVRIRATGDNADLVEIDENNLMTVVGNITMDTAITVVAELVSNPAIFTTKVITIKGPNAGAWIKITPDKYTITMASDGHAIINVTTHNDSGYTVTISGDTDNVAYYNANSHRLLVIKDVSENTEIKLIATLTENPTVKDEVTFTVAPAPIIPTITISAKNDKDIVSKDSALDLNVRVSTNEAYDLTVDDENLVKIEGAAGSEKLTVVGNNTFDRTVTVTATLRSDKTVKTTKTFVVLAPRTAGKVSGKNTEITNALFDSMGEKSMTVSGLLTDVRENFNEKVTIENKYDIVVKMTDGVWYGAWNVIKSDGSKDIVNEDTYFKSDTTATINGVQGHVMKRSYVDMNNVVTSKAIVDYRSVPVLWENQHLWNHFGSDNVNNYMYLENESTDDYDIYEFIADKENMDVAYFLTYLSYAYTPLLDDTLDTVYLKVAKVGGESKVIGMIAYTEFLYYGASSEADGASAVSYSKIDISFTDVGTTTIPSITTYPEPTHADKLQAAINNMKAATNYTFKAIETSTYAPSYDDDDYSYAESVSVGDSIQTLSTSYNYTAAASPLDNGDVGLQGLVTTDAILIKKTSKYSAAMDDNVFRVENYGYYQKDDTHYDFFEYNSDLRAFQGKRQYAGEITDRLPSWNFSANIFEFIGTGGTSSTPTYRFRLRDASITRDVAMAVSMHSYAQDGSSSATQRMTIEVTTDGSRVVSTMYPYSLVSGTYMGYITTTYSNIGTTTIADEEFEDYAPRVVSPNWVDYQLKYYHPDHTTQSAYAEGTGETILNIMFGDKWTAFPRMTVFTDAFGDSVSGPFFEWDEIPNPNGGDPLYKDYFALTADTEDYDENMEISNETYNRIIGKLTQGLKAAGFTVVYETPEQDPADRTDRYISYANTELGCQIKVENNHTKNFWIYVGYLGDWSFN